MSFLIHIETSRILTQAAVDTLHSSGLIEPWQINVVNGNQTANVEGLYCINETSMNSLSEELFIKLHQTEVLSIAYAQLFSMNQISVLADLGKIQEQMKSQAVNNVNVQSGIEGFRLSQDDGTLKFGF